MRGVVSLAALALACGTSGGGQVFQGGDFQVGTISFHVASGAAVRSPGLALVLTDQPDTCQALRLIPVQRMTRLSLSVAPGADGSTHATVVAKPSPGAGEATGSLSQSTGGAQGPHYDAAAGSIAWTENTGGSVTITSLDVGFAGTADRIAPGAPVTVSACTP